MASLAAYDAFHDYLEGEWSATPIQYENDAELSDQLATFLYVELFAGLYAQESIGAPGANLWREAGQAYLHLMVLRGSGTRAARELATDLSGLFRERGPAGIRIIDMSIGAGEPGADDGNYFRFTVQVGWERDSV